MGENLGEVWGGRDEMRSPRRPITDMKKYQGTVKELAAKCKCTPEHMSYVLNGRRKPSAPLALRIEQATGGAVTRMELLYPEEKVNG